ncbi:MAG: hypothetical protein CVV27_02265 [Candidatus Melainabacteria bacterium HGW-Melainabacteria-1]|nr:MAG: hypothetical protein CVV27_02265 [Candidatus Melainabacteria bacterium HGW-Melainabacteria-1]
MINEQMSKSRAQKFQQGFTLVEILIASTILLVVMGLTMNSLLGFNRHGNQMLAQTALEEQLRTSLNRLERELIEGAEVLASYNSSSTGAHTLVLSVPVYNDVGFIVVDESTNKPVTDTLVFEAEEDPQADYLSLNRTPPVRPHRLLLTLIPHAKSNRLALEDQVIARNLMPKDSDNYLFPQNGFGTEANSSSTTGPTFSYYQISGGVATAANVSTERTEISYLKVLLWGEQNQGGRLVTAKKELDVRLRNWEDPSP